MKFSTEATNKMAEIMVNEMERVGAGGDGIRKAETAMREFLREVGAEALGHYLERMNEQMREQEKGCECGSKMEYRFKREAVIVSVFGRVRFKRDYYTCGQCHKGQSPLDQKMGIEAGEVTAGLAEMLALAGVEVAFEEASRWLERFLLFRVSDNTIRKETERFGSLYKAEEEQWKEQSQQESWLQERQSTIGKQSGRLYGSIDGVMAPLKEEWRELKNIAWYRVEHICSHQERRHHASCVGEQKELQAQDISYHCDIQSADNFRKLFWATVCQRKADLYDELVFVCDGAVWIWKLIEHYFPYSVQIVDWYHASEYLPPIAEAVFGKDTPEYRDWLEQARTQLWEGQIDDLIHDCQILLAKTTAKQAIEAALSYFTNNRKRMDYARFREQGYFIGSGTVESGGKQIATLRLKRSGARWTEDGAVSTAKARAAWLSGYWDHLAILRDSLPLAV